MADTTKRSTPEGYEADGPAVVDPDSPKSRKRTWPLIASPRWLSAVLVAFLLGQWATMVAFSGRSPAAASLPPAHGEISLGKFRFIAKPTEAGQITQADFSLYVVLVDQTEREAIPRLNAHQYRVRQHIEELLRTAHSADFEDPVLGELKRQLQERINATLGMRAVRDVIIVDLNLGRSPHPAGSVRRAAEPTPNVGQRSGS